MAEEEAPLKRSLICLAISETVDRVGETLFGLGRAEPTSGRGLGVVGFASEELLLGGGFKGSLTCLVANELSAGAGTGLSGLGGVNC